MDVVWWPGMRLIRVGCGKEDSAIVFLNVMDYIAPSSTTAS